MPVVLLRSKCFDQLISLVESFVPDINMKKFNFYYFRKVTQRGGGEVWQITIVVKGHAMAEEELDVNVRAGG